MIPRVSDRRIVTYGFSPQADVRAINIEPSPDGGRFDVADRRPRAGAHAHDRRPAPADARRSTTCRTRWPPSPSRNELGIDDDVIRRGLAGFSGVKRRFTQTGEATASP